VIRRSRTRRTGFWHDGAGAAAVEFALIIPFLLALIFSTFEAGWIMLQSIMLDRGLDLAVRELRIGSMANPTQALLRERVCEGAILLPDCDEHLALELFPITTAGAGYPTDSQRCINRNSDIQPVLRFTQGGQMQTMFVRACFVVSPLTPGMGLALALNTDETGAIRILSKSGFVNEPT
jgi:hypothetical protein